MRFWRKIQRKIQRENLSVISHREEHKNKVSLLNLIKFIKKKALLAQWTNVYIAGGKIKPKEKLNIKDLYIHKCNIKYI